ncbi:hypothetical protein ACFL2I_03930 [Candidatus Omnitrophota bacterium]
MRHNQGLTLVELLTAALVASLAIGATVVCFSQVFYLSEVAKDTSVAVSDIRDMMEEIWSTPFDFIVSSFPDGDIDGPPANNYANVVGGYTLGSESIVVDYADVAADPLELAITASWLDTRGHPRTIQLSTFRTR